MLGPLDCLFGGVCCCVEVSVKQKHSSLHIDRMRLREVAWISSLTWRISVTQFKLRLVLQSNGTNCMGAKLGHCLKGWSWIQWIMIALESKVCVVRPDNYEYEVQKPHMFNCSERSDRRAGRQPIHWLPSRNRSRHHRLTITGEPYVCCLWLKFGWDALTGKPRSNRKSCKMLHDFQWFRRDEICKRWFRLRLDRLLYDPSTSFISQCGVFRVQVLFVSFGCFDYEAHLVALVIAPRCWSLSGHGDISFNGMFRKFLHDNTISFNDLSWYCHVWLRIISRFSWFLRPVHLARRNRKCRACA